MREGQTASTLAVSNKAEGLWRPEIGYAQLEELLLVRRCRRNDR